MTAVMMCGGRRDGEILEVPGGHVPESKTVRLTMKPPFEFIDLDIVPREAFSGPAWKIDLPKELW